MKQNEEIQLVPVGKPEVKIGLNRNEFLWADLGLTVVADRITDEGKAELYFYHDNGNGRILLHMGQANLLSTAMYREFVKALNTRITTIGPNLDWHGVLTYVANDTMQELRKGEPVMHVGKQPETSKLEYQLAPILEKNQATTIYGPGGSAKSYLADYISCLVQFGISKNGLSWQPIQGNVLFLDWEGSHKDHERRVWSIKKGMKMKAEGTFLYRFCSEPLASDIHAILPIVFENDVVLTIVDSQIAAMGYGPDPAQLATQYYNALRSLRCATLTIDHVTKEDMRSNSDSVGPYGSVVKYNRSRSVFEIRKSQMAGEEFVELSLIHRKHNEGRLLKPIGIRIDFHNDANGHLDSVTFNSCDLAQNPILSKSLSIRDRLIDELKHGPMTTSELSEAIRESQDSVRAELNRSKNIFTRLDNVKHVWGLLDSDHSVAP